MEGVISSNLHLKMLRHRWQRFSNQLPEGVHLLAVSKGHSASSIRELAGLGQLDFGESRLQEALPKIDQLADIKSLRWHFIGRLQANKVRAVVRAFEIIHSVDSKALAERISRIAGEEKLISEVMLQVKFREDPNKGGFDPEQLINIWSYLKSLTNLKIIGLMTMAPMRSTPEERLELFKECRLLANQLALKECSMGMSGDWQEAVKTGSTWLRVGSVLFGKRPSDIQSSN